MSRNKALSSHVKRLLTGVSDHGIRHLTEVEADLRQTSLLLEEAIEKLGANFMAIHAVVSAQQQTIDLLLSGGKPEADAVAGLVAMPDAIGGHVNAAVTCMQFQDMTNQLLDRTLKRVTGLREFLGTLGSNGAEIHQQAENDDIMNVLSNINTALAVQSLELRSVLRKAVDQKHLESGDIELF
ncbi:chemotaxis protein [Massilia sp. W12]|uniref:chemotaxis protein n=1 Tax=Massilia sp. W12 TaxID=3126507 RepID=UPI0030D0631E